MLGNFRTVLVFFNRHGTTMGLVKENQRRHISVYLKRWPIYVIVHMSNTAWLCYAIFFWSSCSVLSFLMWFSEMIAKKGAAYANVDQRNCLTCVSTINLQTS